MVSKDKLIQNVNAENLYHHILQLQGIKHPLDTPNDLSEAADYTTNVMKKFGVVTSKQPFKIKGMEDDYYNVVGYLHSEPDQTEPLLIISSHYDTVYNTPGADDNASAVAVMLETSRILKEANYGGNVLFVSFNLEESSPYMEKKRRELMRKYNFKDENNLFTSWYYSNLFDQFRRISIEAVQGKEPFSDDVMEETLSELKSLVETSKEMDFFKEWFQLNQELGKDPIGNHFVCGSNAFVEEALEKKLNIAGVINLETIAFCSNKPNSQQFPQGINPELFEKFNTDENLTTGDFISIVSDENSSELAKSFFNSCKIDSINLPAVNVTVPFDYEFIRRNMWDLLRSDHAPFWKHGYKGLMISDSANFRNPFYHTPGDIINTLDFSFLKKVCQATIATTISHLDSN
jgi:hypothetical protein